MFNVSVLVTDAFMKAVRDGGMLGSQAEITHQDAGGSLTIKQVGRTFGPSERYTADLADLDQSTLNTVTGQGGNFLSPYYMDQWKAWYEGTTFTLPFSAQAVQAAKAHTLQLDPTK